MSKDKIADVGNVFVSILKAIEASLDCILDADELYPQWNEAQTHRDIEQIRDEIIQYSTEKRTEIINAIQDVSKTETVEDNTKG